MIRPQNVLSLFDGISCGRIALERAGIQVDTYYASEIDPIAIEISKKNYPDIIHIGDVTELDFTEYSNIDLLIGGSPCQALSNSNVYLKDGEYGVNGTGVSSLFWHYVRALKTIKPKWFLFENVYLMKKADKEIITEELGVQPVMINSVMFSGQMRRRLYWTNIPFIPPEDRMVSTKLKDILLDEVDERYHVMEKTLKFITTPSIKSRNKHSDIDPEYGRAVVASCWRTHRANTDTYVSTNKAPFARTNVRRITPLECERLQTLPDNYTLHDGISDKCRYIAIGNGWTVNVIAYIFRELTVM